MVPYENIRKIATGQGHDYAKIQKYASMKLLKKRNLLIRV